MMNIDAAQPDPYENIKIDLPVNVIVWSQIKLSNPLYSDPV
jgi:hypothetical protein